jgi:hypothetical protein
MAITINGTTGIAGVDGSASTPAVQGTDTNTGIFFPAADTIAFGEGGAEVMRIDSSGNVGIGVTPNTKLQVYGGSGNLMKFQSSTGMGTAGEKIDISFTQASDVEVGKISYVTTSTGNIALAFSTYASGLAERARITSGGDFQFNSGYGSVATAYGCRAWVNFNGTGTVAIRGSGNVSSITDNGTGAYTVNFSTALIDANYCINATGTHDNGSYAASAYVSNDIPPTTSAVRIDYLSTANAFTDVSFAQVSIFR